MKTPIPTDIEIVRSIDNEARVTISRLVAASYVLDEFVNETIKSSKMPGPLGSEYRLIKEQVEGISYMLDHVRFLAVQVEQEVDKAFGQEDLR
jgi:hypothetical protein